jgi:gamma-glutamyltranspeptidase/glutathione hydrolase
MLQLRPNPFSRPVRSMLLGVRGAVSSAHPLATAAAQEQINNGGSAADAVVAAQAVLSVIAPEACGLGGDAFFLIRDVTGATIAVNAAGRSAAKAAPTDVRDDGTSVAVPGMVAGWDILLKRWGRRGWTEVLAPALRLAVGGFPARPHLIGAMTLQRDRLIRGGAQNWSMLNAVANGSHPPQPELARTLQKLSERGVSWFYTGSVARNMSRAIQRRGGLIEPSDFAAHETVVAPPLTLRWRDWILQLQPPMSQGILLGMALNGLEKLGRIGKDRYDHAAVELIELAFGYRERVGEGSTLFSIPMEVDLHQAARRGGPQSHSHTAGVAASEANGFIISSLVSVFENFGSAIMVPENGFVLNNRAACFTLPPNEIAPSKLPVHTLAPILIETRGACMGLATPGADGQVQTLLQVLIALGLEGLDLDVAIHRPRWRSENRRLLIEISHSQRTLLASMGHEVIAVPDGDSRLGSVVCAGLIEATPFAVSDWRHESWSGVA